jgi:hypothetical protein
MGTRPWLVSTNRRGRRLTNWGGKKEKKKRTKRKEHRQLKGMRCPAKSQIRDASGVRLLLLSSTSPIAAASSCYVERCTGFDATLVKQASKQTRSEAKHARTRTRTKGQSYSVWHTNTQQSVLIPIHTHPQKNSPSSIIPSRYYPITSMHQFHGHKFNCCFYWAMPLGQGLCMNHLGFATP